VRVRHAGLLPVLSRPGGMRGFVRSEDVCDIALQENRKVGVSFS